MNDNAAQRLDDAMLIGALRHFAQHGISAAEHARSQALMADHESDHETSQYWIAICDQFDRRLADKLRHEIGGFAA